MYLGQDQRIHTSKDIYSFSSVKTLLPRVNRSNWYRVTSYYKKKKLITWSKRAGNKKTGNPAPTLILTSWKGTTCRYSGAMWMLGSLSLLITGCMAWIACESSFFKLVVFHEPRHHATEAAQLFKNCDILFSCFHWQVTCYHFSQAFLWPLVALKYCANMYS